MLGTEPSSFARTESLLNHRAIPLTPFASFLLQILKEGKEDFDPWLKATVHHGGEGLVAGTGGSWSCCMHSQEADRGWYSGAEPQNPNLGNGAAHSEGEPSHFSPLIQDDPSSTHPDLCLQGDSRSCSGDLSIQSRTPANGVW